MAAGLYSFLRRTALIGFVNSFRSNGQCQASEASGDPTFSEKRLNLGDFPSHLSIGLFRNQEYSTQNQLFIGQVTEFRSQARANLADCFQRGLDEIRAALDGFAMRHQIAHPISADDLSNQYFRFVAQLFHLLAIVTRGLSVWPAGIYRHPAVNGFRDGQKRERMKSAVGEDLLIAQVNLVHRQTAFGEHSVHGGKRGVRLINVLDRTTRDDQIEGLDIRQLRCVLDIHAVDALQSLRIQLDTVSEVDDFVEAPLFLFAERVSQCQVYFAVLLLIARRIKFIEADHLSRLAYGQ